MDKEMTKEADYIPFGDEWEKEISRIKKSNLIQMLKKALAENKESKKMTKKLDSDYKLIPLDEITNEAREIAVRWGENMKDDFIAQKHKLASDIMNYARLYAAQENDDIRRIKGLINDAYFLGYDNGIRETKGEDIPITLEEFLTEKGINL